MAQKRMFNRKITETDDFLDMPHTSQLLYFHLNMGADDEGFVDNAKMIMRMIGATDDSLKILIAKQFLIPFESGIVVIKDWKIHNYIASDRFTKTVYSEEKSALTVGENKEYAKCIQNVSPVLDLDLDLGIDLDIDNTIVGQEKKSTIDYDYKTIIDYLNEKANTNFRNVDSHKKFIKARYNEGYSKEDFIKVIDNKVSSWINDSKYSTYLRPSTLFGNKFDNYLNESSNEKKPKLGGAIFVES